MRRWGLPTVVVPSLAPANGSIEIMRMPAGARLPVRGLVYVASFDLAAAEEIVAPAMGRAIVGRAIVGRAIKLGMSMA